MSIEKARIICAGLADIADGVISRSKSQDDYPQICERALETLPEWFHEIAGLAGTRVIVRRITEIAKEMAANRDAVKIMEQLPAYFRELASLCTN